MQNQPDFDPYADLTDEELESGDESTRDAALSGALSGAEVTDDADDDLDGEQEDEAGDLIEHITGLDHRTPREAAMDALAEMDDEDE